MVKFLQGDRTSIIDGAPILVDGRFTQPDPLELNSFWLSLSVILLTDCLKRGVGACW